MWTCMFWYVSLNVYLNVYLPVHRVVFCPFAHTWLPFAHTSSYWSRCAAHNCMHTLPAHVCTSHVMRLLCAKVISTLIYLATHFLFLLKLPCFSLFVRRHIAKDMICGSDDWCSTILVWKTEEASEPLSSASVWRWWNPVLLSLDIIFSLRTHMHADTHIEVVVECKKHSCTQRSQDHTHTHTHRF